MLQTLSYKSLRLVVRTTPCIVTTPPSILTPNANVLVVPANAALCGTSFPYFPHPEFNPEEPTKLPRDVPPSKWGSVSLGPNQFYPVQCIDGVLQLQAPEIRNMTKNLTCKVGQCVVTKTPQSLPHFKSICHVVPPLWTRNADSSLQHFQQELLIKAYTSAFTTTLSLNKEVVVSMPLLGCGARGATSNDSIAAAISALESLAEVNGTVEFSMQQEDFCVQLLAALDTMCAATKSAGGTSKKYSTVNTSKRKFSTSIKMPEPDSCPQCSDENGYWDGSTLFVCTSCAHEWPIDLYEEASGLNEVSDGEIVRDVNGNTLETGDSVILVKDLAKGKLKKGLKCKLRVGDYGDGHDCQAKIKGLGTYALKGKFLRKV